MTRKHASETSLEVFRTLQWLRKNKFKPVPLHFQSKSAVVNYTTPNWKPPADDLWAKNNYGIGCVTGPPGPIDIDLDCPEAVHFARYFLPPTQAVFGRKTKRSSHYLYRVSASEMPYRALLDVKTNTSILEIRGGEGKHQTVFPGSLHADTGELIEWEKGADPEVPEVDAELLTRAVNMIGAGVHLVRYDIWSAGRHNDITKYLAGTMWRLERSQEEAELLIRALMDFDGDKDRSRISTVRLTYKKAAGGAAVAGAGKLREEIGDKALANRVLELLGSTSTVIIEEYNESYAVVRLGGRFTVANFDVPATDPPLFMSKKDFLDWKSNDLTVIDDKPKPKAMIWLASRERRAYHGVDFLPGQDAPPGVLNLWEGWGVQPSSSGSCDAWLALLRDVICGGNERSYVWMLHWFANIVREPQDKSMTAPVLIGRQGAGKTMLLEYFGRILGKGYTSVTSGEHVHGKHNMHLQNVLLLHSEEAVFGGDRKHLSAIKSQITDSYLMIEPKHVNAYRVKSFMRLALTSNELRAAPTEAGDRRFSVFDSEDRLISEDLIKAVLKERDGGGPARLFQFLLDMPYDPAIPRVNIKNEALVEMKAQNWDPTVEWWQYTLDQGVILPDELRRWRLTQTHEEQKEWGPVVSSRALYISLVIYWQSHRRYGSPPSDTALSFRLNKLVGVKLERKQTWGYDKPQRLDNEPPLHPLVMELSERQSTIVNLPSLADCRAAFERYLGQPVEWTKEDDTDRTPPHRRF
jgi:hypothetical protein